MDRVTIGQIIRVRGIRGEVVVMPLTDDPGRYRKLEEVTIAKEGESGKFTVESAREFKGRVLLHLKNVGSPEEARKLVGGFVEIDKGQLVKLPPDRYFVFDIVGLEVATTKGQRIGKVKEVISLPGYDVYVVEDEERQYDIPAVKEIVKKVDLKKGRMIVQPPEGLLEV